MWDPKTLPIYECLDQKNIGKYDVIHDAEDWMVLELSNGSKTTDDTNDYREKFDREDDIAMGHIEWSDEQL